MAERSGSTEPARFPTEPHGRHESELERLDRQFNDLLQELRVSQTGVQILFAFLLTIGFSTGFTDSTHFERVIYVVTLLATAAATAFFIGPVSYHRLVFRLNQRAALVQAGSRMAQIGLGFLLLAICGSVLLVTHVVISEVWSSVLTAGTATLFIGVWYVIPLMRRARGMRSSNVG